MKKIMIFIGGYLPGRKYGGPVTSISNFVDYLGDEYELRIVCNNHDFKETTPYQNISEGWNRVGKAEVLYLKDEQETYKTFLSILEATTPNLIYCSGTTYFRVNSKVFRAAKKLGISILLAPRGDICDNAIKIKKWKKIPYFKIMKMTGMFRGIYFHATSQEEVNNLNKYLGIEKDKCFLLPNLPADAAPVRRNDYVKESGKIKIVFMSRIQEKKNLYDAIQIVNQLSGEVVFDIYGPLESPAYWQKCQSEMRKAPNNVKISYKGALAPKEAPMIFCNYDCFLFPTWTENYGHVIAESLLHDCPIVISKGTTPWDDMADYNAGGVAELGNMEGFVFELEKITKMNSKEYNQLIDRIRAYVDYKINVNALKQEYVKMLESICCS